jgi:hypothetical protein
MKVKIYGPVILPVGVKTWYITLKNHRLSVFENRVLRKISERERVN